MSKFTAALKVIDESAFSGHVTLCFCDANKGGKVSTNSGQDDATISDVVYWPHVDLTVLLVDSEFAHDRYNYYKENGYTYDHEFIPHITVGKGDVVEDFKRLIGFEFYLGEEYIRIF